MLNHASTTIINLYKLSCCFPCNLLSHFNITDLYRTRKLTSDDHNGLPLREEIPAHTKAASQQQCRPPHSRHNLATPAGYFNAFTYFATAVTSDWLSTPGNSRGMTPPGLRTTAATCSLSSLPPSNAGPDAPCPLAP